jgi:hypothetical protein
VAECGTTWGQAFAACLLRIGRAIGCGIVDARHEEGHWMLVVLHLTGIVEGRGEDAGSIGSMRQETLGWIQLIR